ncbi:MAG: S26 family signal peptidase [Limisphaerales bacterium]
MKTAMPHPSRNLLVFNAYHQLADYRSRLSWAWFFENFSGLAVVAVMGTLSYFLISHFVFQSLTVSGTSMWPTLQDNGNYWLNRSYYYRHEPQRGEIVALKDPVDGVQVVKRIIAHAGGIHLSQPRQGLCQRQAARRTLYL